MLAKTARSRFSVMRSASSIAFVRSHSMRLLSSTTGNAKPNFNSFFADKYFDFGSAESQIYQWWESSKFFCPPAATSNSTDGKEKKSYTVTMPPPNVTGSLHMGHAMFLAIQDLLVRYHRMKGEDTLWVPGTDHAGIATQMLVEKALKAEGTSRKEIGREKFMERIWKFKNENGDRIIHQMKRLGASADWTRNHFTMDPKVNDAVNEAFVRLFEKGLIYRGEYMVNWCPALGTAISDIEVDYTEENGHLYVFQYVLSDGSGHIPIATSRPETVFGDTAICVNPDDDRYKSFIGKTAKVPFLNRDIPIIADSYCDKEFGTGALKVTPAHDHNDYAIAKRHNLEFVNIFDENACLNANAGDMFQGLARFDCRKKVWSELEKSGHAIEKRQVTTKIPRCSRSNDVLEPMVSKQWFMKTKNVANEALMAVKKGDIKILPDRYESSWENWLENNRDWCLSRQLWWGHRIPVFHARFTDNNPMASASDDDCYVVARNSQEAQEKAQSKWPGRKFTLEQDEDVLDTWFSSGLWPFVTLGWPNPDSSDLARFYPTQLMETGYDILFFWVARMVMLGIELTGKVPFDTIYLHGLVRDKNGQKMSKSKGNVVDPLDVIKDIGSDGLRACLLTGAVPGNDIPLSQDRIDHGKHFVTKIWNIGKYVQFAIDNETFDGSLPSMSDMSVSERAIISKCHKAIIATSNALDVHHIHMASKTIHDFIWDDFADWFIESTKTAKYISDVNDRQRREWQAKQVLKYVWEISLRLLHPFMPFVTEVVWQKLLAQNAIQLNGSNRDSGSIMHSSWPIQDVEINRDQYFVDHQTGTLAIDEEAERAFGRLQSIVRSFRNIRSEYKIEHGKKIPAIIVSTDISIVNDINKEKGIFYLMCKVDENGLQLEHVDDFNHVGYKQPEFIEVVVEEKVKIFIPVAKMFDIEKERTRLSKQLNNLQGQKTAMEQRLFNLNQKPEANAARITTFTASLHDIITQISQIEENLKGLDKL